MDFLASLKRVIESDRVNESDAEFAKAVEAVAIAWSFPEKMMDAGMTLEQKEALDALVATDERSLFEVAVDWMEAQPDCVNQLQGYYTEVIKDSKISAAPENREKMLKNILPACARSINKLGDLGRLFNKGSIKKIEELATTTSLKEIAQAIPAEIADEKTQENLEQFFLIKVKQMLNLLLTDFKTLFPDPAFFDQFSDQFSQSWKEGDLSAKQKRNTVIAGLMAFEAFNLEADILTTEGQTLNYWVVAGLSNAISSFLRGFSEMPEEQQGENFYEGFQHYIDTVAFPGNEFEVDSATLSEEDQALNAASIYHAFPEALPKEIPTFITQAFIKLSGQAAYDRVVFNQVLGIKKSVDLEIFVLGVVECLLNAGNSDLEELQYRLNALFENDIEMFIRVMNKASAWPGGDYLVTYALGMTEKYLDLSGRIKNEVILPNLRIGKALDPLRTLLYQSALNNEHNEFTQLISLLPQGAASVDERDRTYKKNFLASLDEKKMYSAVPDGKFIEEYIRTMLQGTNSALTKAMLNILDSNVPLLNKLQLIGAIALGKNEQPRHLSIHLSSEGRLCQTLARFNAVESEQNIKTTFSQLLVEKKDKKAERNRGREILLEAGKSPGKEDAFVQYFARWMQFCIHTGEPIPRVLDWCGDPPTEAEKFGCNNLVRSMGLGKSQSKAAYTLLENTYTQQSTRKLDANNHDLDILSSVLNGSFKSEVVSQEKKPIDFSQEKNILKLLHFYEYGQADEREKAAERVDALCSLETDGERIIRTLAILSNQITGIQAKSKFFQVVPEAMREFSNAIAEAIKAGKPSVEILLLLKNASQDYSQQQSVPGVQLQRVQDVYVAIKHFFHESSTKRSSVVTESASHTISALLSDIHAAYSKPIPGPSASIVHNSSIAARI